MVKNVIANLDSSKAFRPDCIPAVVLKKCEPDFSYIIVELFKTCLEDSCFPDCWEVLSVVTVFQNVQERSPAKSYRSVCLHSIVSKVFKQLVNNRIVEM